MDRNNLIKEIKTLIHNGERLLKDGGLSSKFSSYSQDITALSKKIFLEVQADNHLKGLVIRLLDLKLDYSIIYRVALIGKFRMDLLENWNEVGKYKYYIERSGLILDAILYGLSEKK